MTENDLKLNILHIADLHLSETKQSRISKISSKLFEDITKLKLRFNLDIDLVLFTGDLIQNGSNIEKEFNLANNILIKVSTKYITSIKFHLLNIVIYTNLKKIA